MSFDRFKVGKYVWVPYDSIDESPSHFAKIVKVDDEIQEGFTNTWIYITVEGPYGRSTYPSSFLGSTCEVSDEEYRLYVKEHMVGTA